MSIARTADGLEGAILIDANGAVVLSSSGGPTGSVWSAADAAATGLMLSNGGLTFTSPAVVGFNSIRGTISHTTGKYYVEFLATSTSGNNSCGVANSTFNPVSVALGTSNYSAGIGFPNRMSAGFTLNYAQTSWCTPGDVCALAIDFDAGSIWIAFKGAWQDGNDPATGLLPIISFDQATVGALFPALSPYNLSEVWTLQSTPASQKYLPPPGFQAWDGGPVTTETTTILNPSDLSNVTLSNNNLTVTRVGNAIGNVRSNTSHSTGKWHVEFNNVQGVFDGFSTFGFANDAFVLSSGLGLDAVGNSLGWRYFAGPQLVGYVANSPYTGNANIPINNGDSYAMEIDFDAGQIWMNNITRGGVWWPSVNFGNAYPAISGPYFIDAGFTSGAGGGSMTVNFGATPFAMTPRAGFLAWDAPAMSPEAAAYLARTTGGNAGGNAANIIALIDGLVADGVWPLLDCLYVLAQQNEADALLNLIGTSYLLTQVGALGRSGPRTGTIIFTQYRGFDGFNTAASYFDTGFDPTVSSPNFTQNSASFGVWTNFDWLESAVVFGNGITGGTSHLYPHFTDNNFYARVNSPTTPGTLTPASAGLYVGDRPSSSAVNLYYNGTNPWGDMADASQTLASNHFRLGAGIVGASRQQFAAAFIGASLGDAGQLALYNRLRAYMTAVGVSLDEDSTEVLPAHGMTNPQGKERVT
jgi:hypothetical protein